MNTVIIDSYKAENARLQKENNKLSFQLIEKDEVLNEAIQGMRKHFVGSQAKPYLNLNVSFSRFEEPHSFFGT